MLSKFNEIWHSDYLIWRKLAQLAQNGKNRQIFIIDFLALFLMRHIEDSDNMPDEMKNDFFEKELEEKIGTLKSTISTTFPVWNIREIILLCVYFT